MWEQLSYNEGAVDRLIANVIVPVLLWLSGLPWTDMGPLVGVLALSFGSSWWLVRQVDPDGPHPGPVSEDCGCGCREKNPIEPGLFMLLLTGVPDSLINHWLPKLWARLRGREWDGHGWG